MMTMLYSIQYRITVTVEGSVDLQQDQRSETINSSHTRQVGTTMSEVGTLASR